MNKLACLLAIFIIQINAASADTLTAIKARMQYLNERQSLIAKNISNVNTPGYKAQELKKENFNKIGERTNKLSLRTTSAGHLGGQKRPFAFKTIRDEDAYETNPNGNNVVLEEQMVNLAENEMDYKETTSVMKQLNGLIRSAIGGQR